MRLLVLIGLVVSAAACSASGDDATSAVRFIHAAPGADSLDVFIAGNAVFEVVRLGAVTPYESEIEADQQPVRVRTSVGAAELLRFEVNLIPDGRQTIVAAGTRAEIRAIVLDDAQRPARLDSAQVRIVHAAALSDSVAAYLIRPAASDTALAVPRIDFRQNTGFRYAPAGTHRLRFTTPDGGTVLFDETVELAAGDAVTLVAADADVTGGITLIRADD